MPSKKYDLDCFRAMWLAGELKSTIMKRLGMRSKGTVEAWRDRLGLPKRRQGWHNAAGPVADAVALADVLAASPIKRIAARHGVCGKRLARAVRAARSKVQNSAPVV